MTNKIFKHGEPEAVEWLAEREFFSVIGQKVSKSIQLKDYLTGVGLHDVKPCCKRRLYPDGLDKAAIRKYVKAFEIDYIAVYGRYDTKPLNPEVPHREARYKEEYKYMGIEAKYFYKTNLDNKKYHQGIGQLIEYLKWGFNYATLVHIFDRNIEKNIDELKNKIDEFKKPAFDLFSLLQNKCDLPLAYVYLIVDEKKDLKRSLQNENMCWIPRGSTQPNPFKNNEITKKIREELDKCIHNAEVGFNIHPAPLG